MWRCCITQLCVFFLLPTLFGNETKVEIFFWCSSKINADKNKLDKRSCHHCSFGSDVMTNSITFANVLPDERIKSARFFFCHSRMKITFCLMEWYVAVIFYLMAYFCRCQYYIVFDSYRCNASIDSQSYGMKCGSQYNRVKREHFEILSSNKLHVIQYRIRYKNKKKWGNLLQKSRNYKLNSGMMLAWAWLKYMHAKLEHSSMPFV